MFLTLVFKVTFSEIHYFFATAPYAAIFLEASTLMCKSNFSRIVNDFDLNFEGKTLKILLSFQGYHVGISLLFAIASNG